MRQSYIGLSPQELRVARLIAMARTNRQIAEELVIEIRTVERHINYIIAKLFSGVECQARVAVANWYNITYGDNAPKLEVIHTDESIIIKIGRNDNGRNP